MSSYKVVFSDKALKQLIKLDKFSSKLIVTWIKNNLDGTSNPRIYGKSLTSNLSGYWRYRVGDFRILSSIEDKKVVIQILKIGHRRDIYKDK